MQSKWCEHMVIIGDVKDGHFDVVEDEIRQIHEACNGHILKKSLSKRRFLLKKKSSRCEVVTKAGLEFVDINRFLNYGSQHLGIALMKKHVSEGVLEENAVEFLTLKMLKIHQFVLEQVGL